MNLHMDTGVCVCVFLPGQAEPVAMQLQHLVGQCAISPFISTSPSLLSLPPNSPLTHHPSIHSSPATYLAHSTADLSLQSVRALFYTLLF